MKRAAVFYANGTVNAGIINTIYDRTRSGSGHCLNMDLPAEEHTQGTLLNGAEYIWM
jgi:hypothetical protein